MKTILRALVTRYGDDTVFALQEIQKWPRSCHGLYKQYSLVHAAGAGAGLLLSLGARRVLKSHLTCFKNNSCGVVLGDFGICASYLPDGSKLCQTYLTAVKDARHVFKTLGDVQARAWALDANIDMHGRTDNFRIGEFVMRRSGGRCKALRKKTTTLLDLATKQVAIMGLLEEFDLIGYNTFRQHGSFHTHVLKSNSSRGQIDFIFGTPTDSFKCTVDNGKMFATALQKDHCPILLEARWDNIVGWRQGLKYKTSFKGWRPDVGWEHFARGMHEAVCVGDSLKDVAGKCVEVAKGMEGTTSAGRKYKARNKTKELLEAEAELTKRIEDRKLCMDFEEAKKLSRARNLQRKKVRNLQQQRKWEVQCMQNRRPQQLSLGEFEGSKDLEEWGGLFNKNVQKNSVMGMGAIVFFMRRCSCYGPWERCKIERGIGHPSVLIWS